MGDRRGLLRRSITIAAAAPLAAPLRRALAAAIPAPPPVDPRGPVLGPLLAANRERHPGARFSNHLSMALLSLAALGGTPAQVQAMGEAELSRAKPFPTGGPAVSPLAWRRFLGNMEALPGLRALFTAEIAKLGVTGTLRLYLPDLLPGLAAHAFHAIIRTACGVRFRDPAEVAMGLAYWSAAFLPLGPLTAPGRSADPAVALAAVRATPDLRGVQVPDGLNIAEQMKWVSALPAFAPAASALRIDDTSLAGLAVAAVRFYLVPEGDGDDFAALHGVTGTHAYRVLEPYVVDRAAGRRHLWQALVAAYVARGAPEVVVPPPVQLPSWTEVLAAAASTRDDHHLKLVDIAREEARHTGDASYLRAAAFRLRLV